MLSEVHIKGLAVIDKLSIHFSKELNVITGETGAGKSILIKALSLVLGGKGSSDMVRKGADSAVVSASFTIDSNHSVFTELHANGLGIESGEGELILRRQINQKGRSQAWINDIPVTLNVLKSIGSGLIDIFGQHDNHKLLEGSQHAQYLDQFINQQLLVDYKSLFNLCWKELKDLGEAIQCYQEKLRDFDYLKFRKAELDRLSPSAADYSTQKLVIDESRELLEKHQMLCSVESIVDRGYGGKALSDALSEATRKLNPLYSGTELLDMAHEVEEQLNQLSFEIGKELAKSDFDENEVDVAKSRLSFYHDMMHKMNVRTVESLIVTYENIASELDFIENGKGILENRILDLASKVTKLSSLGQKLTTSRKRGFQKVKKQIRRELDQLNMKGADLFLQLNEVEQRLSFPYRDLFEGALADSCSDILEVMAGASSEGFERPQFLLRSNPGEEPKQLSKIASGGEISRIMLGIKKVLSEGAQTCVMVFDEIDTGISGETASIVGRKLSEISEKFQVICISHLPQVAVFGERHFKVQKSIVRGRAESKIIQMTQEQCLEEVARLLSSGRVTESSIENAKDLFRNVEGFSV